jgi:predicted RecA/RadA family phage recombinase
MTRTYVSPGDVIEAAAPAATVSGRVVKIGRLLAVSLGDYGNGAPGRFGVKGIYRAPAVEGAEFVAGQQAIWDVSALSNLGAFDDHSATPATGDVSVAAVALETKTAGAADTILVHLDARIGTVA